MTYFSRANKIYWIGLYRTDSSTSTNPSYAWLDGSGELDVSSKNCDGSSTVACAVFSSKGFIQCNQDCTSSNRFICRRKALPPNGIYSVSSETFYNRSVRVTNRQQKQLKEIDGGIVIGRVIYTRQGFVSPLID